MKEKTACFTGHREIPQNEQDKVTDRLYEILKALAKKGYCNFIAGGALGFDTLAAQTVLKIKSEYANKKLILVLPCKNQTGGWADIDKKAYESIKEQADEVIYTSDTYFRGCMHKRNRYMVDLSSLCICYLKKESGGTAYTVKYAEKSNLDIINIA